MSHLLQVASFNFDPGYKNKDDPIITTKLPSNLTLFHCHQDVFSLGIEQNRKFNDSTEEWIWTEGHRADYLVVGPLQSMEHLSVCECVYVGGGGYSCGTCVIMLFYLCIHVQ